MRHKALVLLVISLLFSSLALAQAKPRGKTAGAKTTAKATGAPSKAFMQQILDAWATMNPDNVARYYDQAPGDVFYDVAPVKYNGWQEYAAGFRQLAATLQSMKFTLNDDAAVHPAGAFAWGTAMTDKAGKTSNLDCRWTIVWQKKGANWVIVHDHFSVPIEAPK